jgi:hypothetical protein
MNRNEVLRAIEFQGIIDGCADHQWLLTDALYDSGKTPPDDSSSRWVVHSELVGPSSPAPTNEGHQTHYTIRDREEGWSVSADSAPALAQRIREQVGQADS